MLSRLRGKLEGLLSRAAELARKLGLKPNWLTAGSLALAALAAALYLRLEPVLAGIALLSAGLLDAIDGALARVSGRVTKLGSFLDSTCDRVGDALAISGMIVAKFCGLEWGLTALVGSLLVSYARAKAESLGVSPAGIGVGERAERMLVLGVSSVAIPLWPMAIELGVAIVAVLCVITIVQRVGYVYRILKKS